MPKYVSLTSEEIRILLRELGLVAKEKNPITGDYVYRHKETGREFIVPDIPVLHYAYITRVFEQLIDIGFTQDKLQKLCEELFGSQ